MHIKTKEGSSENESRKFKINKEELEFLKSYNLNNISLQQVKI